LVILSPNEFLKSILSILTKQLFQAYFEMHTILFFKTEDVLHDYIMIQVWQLIKAIE